MDNLVYGVGLVLGALAIITVCAVYLKKQTFGIGGGALSLVGMLLVGMSVWSHAKIEVSAEGISAEVEQLQEAVNEMAVASATLSEEVKTVAQGSEATKQELVRLSKDLQTANALSPQKVRNLEQTINSVPKASLDRIDNATRIFRLDRRTPPR